MIDTKLDPVATLLSLILGTIVGLGIIMCMVLGYYKGR